MAKTNCEERSYYENGGYGCGTLTRGGSLSGAAPVSELRLEPTRHSAMGHRGVQRRHKWCYSGKVGASPTSVVVSVLCCRCCCVVLVCGTSVSSLCPIPKPFLCSKCCSVYISIHHGRPLLLLRGKAGEREQGSEDGKGDGGNGSRSRKRERGEIGERGDGGMGPGGGGMRRIGRMKRGNEESEERGRGRTRRCRSVEDDEGERREDDADDDGRADDGAPVACSGTGAWASCRHRPGGHRARRTTFVMIGSMDWMGILRHAWAAGLAASALCGAGSRGKNRETWFRRARKGRRSVIVAGRVVSRSRHRLSNTMSNRVYGCVRRWRIAMALPECRAMALLQHDGKVLIRVAVEVRGESCEEYARVRTAGCRGGCSKARLPTDRGASSRTQVGEAIAEGEKMRAQRSGRRVRRRRGAILSLVTVMLLPQRWDRGRADRW